MSVHMSAVVYGGGKRVSDPLELVVVSCLAQVLDSGPLQKQYILITNEPPLPHKNKIFKNFILLLCVWVLFAYMPVYQKSA